MFEGSRSDLLWGIGGRGGPLVLGSIGASGIGLGLHCSSRVRKILSHMGCKKKEGVCLLCQLSWLILIPLYQLPVSNWFPNRLFEWMSKNHCEMLWSKAVHSYIL